MLQRGVAMRAGNVLLLLFLLNVAVSVDCTDTATFTEVRARIPCRISRDFRCPVDGTHTRIGLEATVLQQPQSGALNITGYPISHLGSFFDGTDTYPEARFGSPNVCFRTDYCVGVGENVTFDLYVSHVKTRYPLVPWINGVPYESFVSRTTNLTEVAVNRTRAPVLPPADCLPYNTPTDNTAFANQFLPFQCERRGFYSVNDTSLDARSRCPSLTAFADPLPTSGVSMSGSEGGRICRATVCPTCAPEGQAGTDVAQFVTVGSVECAAYGIRSAPKSFVEVLLTVRNHDTGHHHELYSVVHVGSTGGTGITSVGDSPIRMRIELAPKARSGNGRDASGPLIGDSIMICGDEPHTLRRLRNPFAMPSTASSASLIPVPTRRYTASLTVGALASQENAHPAWYWMPQEDNAIYGRRCGQIGALSQTVTAHSAAVLYDLCYDPSALAACLPPTSPRCIIARNNAYSANPLVLAALQGLSGSDPSLLASERPRNMPPRSIWNDRFVTTYLAAVRDPNTRNSGSFRTSLVVEHVPRTVADRGYDVRVQFDISDSLLRDPVNRLGAKIYHQALSPTDTSCSILQHGWGGVSLTFCTHDAMPVVSSNGGNRLYKALVVCDESVGSMATGYEGTEIVNATAAIIRFQAAVGGPANTCTRIPSPVLLGPDPAFPNNASVTTTAPDQRHYAGSCYVTLFDGGDFGHIQIGDSQEVVCTRFTSQGYGTEDNSHRVFLDEAPNCEFFDISNEKCADSGNFNITALGVVVGVVAVISMFTLVVVCIVMDNRRTTHASKKHITEYATVKS